MRKLGLTEDVIRKLDDDVELLYEMSNLDKDDTGFSFKLHLIQDGEHLGLQHGNRVKVDLKSKNKNGQVNRFPIKVLKNNTIEPLNDNGEYDSLKGEDLKRVKLAIKFIEQHIDLVQAYWQGKLSEKQLHAVLAGEITLEDAIKKYNKKKEVRMKYQIKIGIDFETSDFDIQNDSWDISEAVDLCNENSFDEFKNKNGKDYLVELADYYSDEDCKILQIEEDFYIDEDYFYVNIETSDEIDLEVYKHSIKDLAVELFTEFPFETNNLTVSGGDIKSHFDMNDYSETTEYYEYDDGEISATLILKDITIKEIK